jgi:hypothetical protein
VICGKSQENPPKPAALPVPAFTWSAPPAFTYAPPPPPTVKPSPAPSALALPAGVKMTPAKWCGTYAKTFLTITATREKIEYLRRPKRKNGFELDNTARNARADKLWAQVEAFDPGRAIADALVSLPHTSYKEAALAAPDGASDNWVNVAMWHAYDNVGRARDNYTEEWNSTLLGPDDADGARFYGLLSMTEAVGEPPTKKPGSGRTGLCYVQRPWNNSSGGGSGGTVSGGGASGGGCEYHGRPKGTWKVWRWGDWNC